MAAIHLQGLVKRYGEAEPVVRGLDLHVEDGEFMVLVGPSGCGKSTTLRMLAGLEQPSAGRVWIGGRDVTDTPPSERGVAMVFQSYALYPHMTVAENMGFALRLAGRSKAEIAHSVQEAARMLHLEPLLQRKPKDLSGGQRQRVAIGRAIVRRPQVFLFDEPLSNLDAALRNEMRVELARLHEQLGATIVYVTHDQVEAMTLGDRIAVFQHGNIEHVGPPIDVYERPANRFVAGFLGSPRINLLPTALLRDAAQTLPPDAIQVGVRPEHVRLVDSAAAGALRGELEVLEHLGDTCLAYVKLADTQVIARLPAHEAGRWTRHATVGLAVSPQALLCFDSGGRRVPQTDISVTHA